MVLGRLCSVGFAAAVAVSHVQASSVDLNPVTASGLMELPLTEQHPALGREIPANSLAFAISVPETPVNNLRSRDLQGRELAEPIESRDLERIRVHYKKLVTDLNTLTQYKTSRNNKHVPWPGSYWPTYQDGINVQWNPKDTMPASEKFARAHGLDPKAFMNKVSQTSGIVSQNMRKVCSVDADCTGLKDGSRCGKRKGETKGHCVPAWFGTCHAWAPAAIVEPEPRCAVKKGDITFEPMDIKGLLTQVYDGSRLQTVFTGARFNGPDKPAKLDKYGRYVDLARRDLGPGFFHIAVINIMGVNGDSCVIDITAGEEVWNQPVRGYKIVQQQIMTPAEAAKRFFKLPKYPFDDKATQIAYVEMQVDWVVESNSNEVGLVDQFTKGATYKYLLEMDKHTKIIGGEWVDDSRYNHPDFLWFPTGKLSMDSVSNLGIRYKDISELLAESVACKQISVPSSSSSGSGSSGSGDAGITVPVPSPSSSGSGSSGSGDADITVPVPSPSSSGSGSSGSADADITVPVPSPSSPGSGSSAAGDADITVPVPSPSSSGSGSATEDTIPVPSSSGSSAGGKQTSPPQSGEKPTSSPSTGDKPTTPPAGEEKPSSAPAAGDNASGPAAGEKPTPVLIDSSNSRPSTGGKPASDGHKASDKMTLTPSGNDAHVKTAEALDRASVSVPSPDSAKPAVAPISFDNDEVSGDADAFQPAGISPSTTVPVPAASSTKKKTFCV